MRYRPFGNTSIAVSAVSLALTDIPQRRSPQDWRDLFFMALENGINCFEIVGRDPAMIDGLAEGLEAIERNLLFVGLRLGPTADGRRDFSIAGMSGAVQTVLARAGLQYFDVAMLDDPAEEALPKDALDALSEIRASGRVRQIGVTGQDAAIDAHITAGAFQVLAMPYSVQSGWITRNRLREALDHDMAIIGYDFFPAAMEKPDRQLSPKKALWGRPPDPFADVGTYAFMHATPGWTAEEICLSYALTQPALATIQLTTRNAGRLPELAAVADRDMPPGLAARIEMARFGDVAAGARAAG